MVPPTQAHISPIPQLSAIIVQPIKGCSATWSCNGDSLLIMISPLYRLSVEFQGVDCDLVNCVSTDLCAPLRTPMNDPGFDDMGAVPNGSCLPFVRSVPACSD